MLNPYELAQQARSRAVHNYLKQADALEEAGDLIYDIDPDGARALWLNAMNALTAAKTCSIGLNLEDKSA